MTTWPETLPQEFHREGFSMDFPDGAIRTDMETGQAFQRRRYTAAVQPLQGKMWLDQDQYATLLEFWTVTTGMGATQFSWVHPLTGDAASFRFNTSEPPRITTITAGLYEVQLTMEILP